MFSPPSITINTYASWGNPLNCYGLGFIIILNSEFILLAGAMGTKLESLIQAEITAINLALELCHNNIWKWKPCDCLGVIQMANDFDDCVAWHYKEQIQTLQQNLKVFPNNILECINREDNTIADTLAHQGRQNPQLSLFC